MYGLLARGALRKTPDLIGKRLFYKFRLYLLGTRYGCFGRGGAEVCYSGRYSL